MEIFLEKNRSVLSSNVENYIDVDFEVKNKLLPDENLVDDFSIYEQSVKEKDECCKYRVILNINPLCSNVLFNTISEIVINEGSNYCHCLNYESLDKDEYAPNAINTVTPITYRDAIKNTEYSNAENGKFIYHCGVNIFNNHMLRKKTFIHVNKANYNEGDEKYLYYNTIGDYLRDYEGNVVKENLHINWRFGISESVVNDSMSEMHMYNTDSLDNIKNAFYSKCKESEGWWGFTNPNNINIKNSDNEDITINEMLSDNQPCEFIDLYPDRSLFSFIPKYNNDRRRIENNWDYCLTYPNGKDYDLINEVCGGQNGEIKAKIKTVTNSNGIKLLQCSSFFKHTFSVGDYVNFYYYFKVKKDDGHGYPDFSNPENVIVPISDTLYGEEVQQQEQTRGDGDLLDEYEDLGFQLYQKSVRIYSVGDLNGDNRDRIFSVRYDDIKTIYDFFAAFGCYYKKVTNGCECSYYARIFKKIKNINGESLINDVNKTAFAKNIYGDDIAQIIFTDDVDLCNIKDENGRDISEIYFTAIKRNAGNEKWYVSKDVSDEMVEFSHCFGVLTSGIDFSGIDINEEPFDYNVHYLHNMDSGVCENDQQIANTFSAWGETILNGMPKFVESGITIDKEEFYGDIVEFDYYEYETNTIGNICHRFNTMQRETFDPNFRDFLQDVIVHDDYESSNFETNPFTVDTYYCNDIVNALHSIYDSSSMDNLIYANIHPEGYFYNPHSKIKIKEYGDTIHVDAEYVNYDEYKLTGQNVIYIYKREEGNDILIGKKYIYDYFDFYENHESGVTFGAITPPDLGYESVYFVEGVEGCILTVKVPSNLSFIYGDYVSVYDKITGDIFWGTVKSFKNNYLTIYFNDSCFDDMDILNHEEYFAPDNAERRFFMFWSENSIPFYAKLCINTKEFSWKPILKASELNKNSSLYSLPFSNGRIYIQKNVNFFLKRQDPYGEYGLSYPLYKHSQQFIANPMIKYIIYGNDKVDLSEIKFVTNNTLNTCY